MTSATTSKKRFVGTWIESMMTYLWVSSGEPMRPVSCSRSAPKGLAMTGDGKMAQYKDVIEIKSDDRRTLPTGNVLTPTRHLTADLFGSSIDLEEAASPHTCATGGRELFTVGTYTVPVLPLHGARLRPFDLCQRSFGAAER